jgi:Flp pilus assembly protein TadD
MAKVAMHKNRMILRLLTGIAVLSGGTVLVWALAMPFAARQEAAQLVQEARSALSPPVKGMLDLDSVDCNGARELLSRAVEIEPSNGAARRELPLAEGCSALLRGDLVLAEGGLISAARNMPTDPRPERWLGSLALAQDRFEDAEQHFRHGLELDSTHLPARIGLSDTLAELRQPDRALELLDEVRSTRLGLVETRRGMLLEQLDRADEARRAYELAMELEPDMAEPRNNLAALERDEGNLDAAWRLQQQAIELSPDDSVLLLNAGLLAIARGRDDEAIELLRRGAELDDATADPARALADHLLVLGRVDDALAALSPALENHPRDAALRNSLGNALAAAGRIEDARRAYLTSIEADSRLAEPHNGLAALMLGADDLDGAEEELLRARRLAPANTQVRRNLAELYRRRGELEAAERELRLARALR